MITKNYTGYTTVSSKFLEESNYKEPIVLFQKRNDVEYNEERINLSEEMAQSMIIGLLSDEYFIQLLLTCKMVPGRRKEDLYPKMSKIIYKRYSNILRDVTQEQYIRTYTGEEENKNLYKFLMSLEEPKKPMLTETQTLSLKDILECSDNKGKVLKVTSKNIKRNGILINDAVLSSKVFEDIDKILVVGADE